MKIPSQPALPSQMVLNSTTMYKRIAPAKYSSFLVLLNLAELAELEEEEQFANQADQNPVNDIPNPMQGMEESDNDE